MSIPFRCASDRKHDRKRGAPAYFAFQLDATSVVLDNLEADRQAKSSAKARPFGRKSRVEHPRLHLRRYSFSVVGDGDTNGLVLLPGADPDLALPFDGLRGIYQHVHEHLVELIRIALDFGDVAEFLDDRDPSLD